MKENDYVEMEGVLVNRQLAENLNRKAYKDIEEMLYRSYKGQWVAFVGGELIAVEPTQKKIIEKVRGPFVNGDEILVKLIEDHEATFYLRKTQ